MKEVSETPESDNAWVMDDIAAFRNENARLIDALNACESERSLLGQQVSELENEFELVDREHQNAQHHFDVYQRLFDVSPAPKLLLNAQMEIMLANPAARAFLQVNEEDAFNQFRRYLQKEDSVAFIKAFRQWQSGGQFSPQQVFSLADGQAFTLDLKAVEGIFTSTQPPTLVVIYPVDYARVNDQSMRLSQLALQQLREAVMIVNKNGKIVNVNQAFSEITGYPSEEVMGHDPSMLKSGRQSDAFYQSMWRHLNEHGWWHGEIWNKRKNGDVYPEWLQITKIWDSYANQVFYVATFSDISPRIENQKRLDRLAFFDSLTNLPNRFSLHNYIDNLLLRKRKQADPAPFSVLFLDLDKFKEVNDAYGHSEGDHVLIEATQRITVNLGDTDYAARIGGDEFVLVLSDYSQKKVASIANALIRAIAAPFKINDNVHFLSASIGGAVFPEHGVEAEDLLRRADAAMYQAKAKGRERFHWFDMALEEKTAINHDTIALLRRSIEQPLDCIEMHYQPLMDQHDKVAEMEALVRLKQGEGLLSPDKFIPLAEYHGLIQPFGLALFEKICHDITQHRLPESIRVAVNLSVVQFSDADLVTQLLAICERYHVPLARFNFEVTETATMENLNVVEAGLVELRQHGCEVLLDDFGTGYASLSMLRNLPVDILKVDKSFVDDVGHSANDNGLVIAMLSMARALNLRTVCEGVETQPQADWLKAQGADYLQGYYYFRPQPMTQLKPCFESASFQSDTSLA